MIFPALLFLASALFSLISLYKYGLPKGKLYLVFPAIDIFLALSLLVINALGWFFSWLNLFLIPFGLVYVFVRSRYLKKMYPRDTNKTNDNDKEDNNTNGD